MRFLDHNTPGSFQSDHIDSLRWIDGANDPVLAICRLYPQGLKVPRHAEVRFEDIIRTGALRGQYREAIGLFTGCMALRPNRGNAWVSRAVCHEKLGDGAAAEAEALFERALAIRERALGRDHPDVAASLCDLGGLALDHDRPAEAVARLERAVAIYDAHEGSQADEPSCRFRLARALALAGGDRTRALAEARRAADGFHAAGEVMAAELAEVEVFLAGHPAAPP